MASIYDKQIKNRNFLSPTGFKFIMDKAPKVSFFGNQVNIPQMTLGVAEQPTLSLIHISEPTRPY